MSTRKERIAQNKRTMGKQYGASIKIGAKGKNYNRYDPKTGRWVKVMSANGPSPKMGPAKQGSRTAQSGTVSSAVAAGKKGGPGSVNGTSKSSARRAAPAGRGAGVATAGGSVTPKGKSYAKTGRRTGKPATDAEVLATLIAAGTLPLGVAGAVGRLAAAGAGRAAAAAGGRKAIEAGTRKAIESGTGRVTITRLGPGVRGGGGAARPAPRAITASPRAIEGRRVEPLTGNGRTKTSPIGNPKLDGTGRTGPKTLAQVRSERARKAAATRAANKAKAKPAVKTKSTSTKAKSGVKTKSTSTAKKTTAARATRASRGSA